MQPAGATLVRLCEALNPGAGASFDLVPGSPGGTTSGCAAGDHTLAYLLKADGSPSVVRLLAPEDARELATNTTSDLILCIAVSPAWIRRIFDCDLRDFAGAYHLTAEIREIVLAICHCHLTGLARSLYRDAKAAELICQSVSAIRNGDLVAAATNGTLSRDETVRIFAARDMIDRRWRERLTIDFIARQCGIGRSKLTAGFRELFGISAAEFLTERRFSEAKRHLRASDAHVSTIAYAVGYENNASFTRAFTKRFGVRPVQYRTSCVRSIAADRMTSRI